LPSSAPAPRACCSGSCCTALGIANIVIEQRSADYVLGRIRAGVLEQTTVDLLRRGRRGARMDAEGLPHDGFELCFGGQRHRIDLHGPDRQAGDGLRPDRGHARPDGGPQR
jgi:p-hydroxybenzoate 3-monooxygenase